VYFFNHIKTGIRASILKPTRRCTQSNILDNFCAFPQFRDGNKTRTNKKPTANKDIWQLKGINKELSSGTQQSCVFLRSCDRCLISLLWTRFNHVINMWVTWVHGKSLCSNLTYNKPSVAVLVPSLESLPDRQTDRQIISCHS
jgi:hypothetical protein